MWTKMFNFSCHEVWSRLSLSSWRWHQHFDRHHYFYHSHHHHHHAHHHDAHLPGEMYLTVLAGLACGGGGGGEVSLKAGPNKPPPAPTTPCPTPPCPPPPSPCPPPPRPPCPPEAWEVATPPRQRGSDPDRWGLTTTWLLLLYLELRPHHHDLILSINITAKSWDIMERGKTQSVCFPTLSCVVLVSLEKLQRGGKSTQLRKMIILRRQNCKDQLEIDYLDKSKYSNWHHRERRWYNW